MVPPVIHAQTQGAYSANAKDEKPTGYSFALVVESKVLTTEGDWRRANASVPTGALILAATLFSPTRDR